uniref:Uncharacterized protein n=1 Tax=Amphimedon queenslandica TaxID=400682 RepID=A0A1X7TCK8_AMPQE
MVSYYKNHEKNLEKARDYYQKHKEEILNSSIKFYASNRDKKLKKLQDYYASHLAQRKKYRVEYNASDNQQIRDNARKHYAAVAYIKNAKLRQKYRLRVISVAPKNRRKLIEKMKKKRQRNTAYYKKNATRLKQNRRARYAFNLSEPKQDIKQKYISLIRQKLAKNVGVQKQLKVVFSVDKSLPIAVTQSGINLIASRRLVNLILNI